MWRWLAPMVLLGGCWGGGRPMPDRWDTGRWDTARWETGVDTEVPAPVGTGGVSITYAFAGLDGCEAAGLDSLALRVDGDQGEDVVYPCEDAPLRLFDLAEDTWRVVVIGESLDGLLWRNEPVYVTVEADRVTDLVIEIACVDDGTGGCPAEEGS